MKLDSIVYDVNSLTSAIASELNKNSPTFQAIYPSDTATSLVNTLASYGSMLQYQLVSAMANCYTDSAYSEAGIHQLAETLGNRLHGNISSEVRCTITRLNLNGINNVIIPAGSKFTVGDLNFFNPESIVFKNNINTIEDIQLIQGVLLTSEHVTAGIAGEKIYFCEDFKCNTNRVKVFIDGEEWGITDSFLPYVVTDTSTSAEMKAVILKTEPDGRTYIKFGNNTNGLVPAGGKTVKIEYISNEGAHGNLNNTDLEINLTTPVFYTLTNNTREQLNVAIYATSTASGGFNTQSLQVLRESSPLMFASGQRAVRRSDYKAMFLNHCGYLTCNVWGEYEEAKLYGGYDKIMMNTVYYSGIKAIQHYDLQPIKTLSISLAQIEALTDNLYNIGGNIEGARGFLGSYLITISSYTQDNAEIKVKYQDKYGTGILTCDPNINPELSNFEEQIFPVNSLIQDYNSISSSGVKNYAFRISSNQNNSQIEGDTGFNNNPLKLIENTDKSTAYISSGYTPDGMPSVLSFNNPFQIRLDYEDNRRAIAAFAFRAPVDTQQLPKFMNQFAIYATNLDVTEDDYRNVKNSSQWTRISEMQTFDFKIEKGEWSNWITTNLYQPGTEITSKVDLSGDIPESGDKSIFDVEITEENAIFKVEIDDEVIPSTDYYVDVTEGKLVFNYNIPAGKKLIFYSTVINWLSYNHYVIEIYSVQDTSVATQQIALQQIKAIYKDSASTIWYDNNNTVDLNIPIISDSTVVNAYIVKSSGPTDAGWLSTTTSSANTITPNINEIYYIVDAAEGILTPEELALYKGKLYVWNAAENTSGSYIQDERNLRELALPVNMQYYEYTTTINGVNETNGYKTNDILTYELIAENVKYLFKVTVLNVGNQQFKVELTVQGDITPRINPLRGKSAITVDNVLLNAVNNSVASGGTISITSIPTVKVAGSYTGNFYTNSDIQAFDLPIINKYNHFTTYVEFKQPRIKNVSIEVQVEYENVITYLTVKNNVIKAINDCFELTPFYIGKPLNVSDIWKAINSVEGVKRFMVLNPTTNIDCKPYEVIMLPKENLTIHDILTNSESK